MNAPERINVKLSIHQRIHECMKEVSYVQKDKEVSTGGSGKYWAVTHDAVTALVRPSFVKHGIIVVPRLVSGAMVDTGRKTSSGNPIMRYEGVYVVSFVNADSPEDVIEIPVSAHAEDQGDKAPGKALSYATKYAILKVLMLETGESDEGRLPPARLTAEDMAGIYDKMKAAESLDDLRAIARESLQWADAANDSASYKKISEWAGEHAARFGASHHEREPVVAKGKEPAKAPEHEESEKKPAARTKPKDAPPPAPSPTPPPEPTPTAAKPAPAAMLRLIRAKIAAAKTTENAVCEKHKLTALDGVSIEIGNAILAGLK